MNYTWWDYGPDECGVEPTEDPADEGMVFERFADARDALVRSLIVGRERYRKAISDARALRESEVSLWPARSRSSSTGTR